MQSCLVHAFYKQRQTEIVKKSGRKLSNTLKLNFCYLKIIRFLHPFCHRKIIGDILINKQKTIVAVSVRLYD